MFFNLLNFWVKTLISVLLMFTLLLLHCLHSWDSWASKKAWPLKASSLQIHFTLNLHHPYILKVSSWSFLVSGIRIDKQKLWLLKINLKLCCCWKYGIFAWICGKMIYWIGDSTVWLLFFCRSDIRLWTNLKLQGEGFELIFNRSDIRLLTTHSAIFCRI